MFREIKTKEIHVHTIAVHHNRYHKCSARQIISSIEYPRLSSLFFFHLALPPRKLKLQSLTSNEFQFPLETYVNSFVSSTVSSRSRARFGIQSLPFLPRMQHVLSSNYKIFTCVSISLNSVLDLMRFLNPRKKGISTTMRSASQFIRNEIYL